MNKRLVFCTVCTYEWISRSEKPRCSECGSTKVLDSKDVGSRTEVMNLKIMVEKLQASVDDMDETLASIVDYFVIPKENTSAANM